MLERLILTGIIASGAIWAQSATPAGTGVISGKVLGSEGEPVRKAAVHLHWNGTPRSAALAITDGSGQFRFDSLPPGNYDLRANKEGLGATSYGAVNGSMIGKPIALKDAESLGEIVLRLTKPGTISGRVTERDGEPLVGSEVQVYREGYPRGTRELVQRAAARTNDRGEYRVSGLEPGKYYLAAGQSRMGMGMGMRTADTEPMVFLRQFYGGATEWTRATPIFIQSGTQLKGIDLQLSESRAVTLKGRVTGVPEGAEGQRAGASGGPVTYGPSGSFVNIQVVTSSSGSMPQPHVSTGAGPPEYRFELIAVPPGQHIVNANITVGDTLYVASQRVDATRDPGEITLTLKPAVELKGRLGVEGERAPALTAMTVRLTRGDARSGFNGPMSLSAKVTAEGSFSFPSVPPGVWDIGVMPPIRGGYVKSMRLGERDVLTQEMEIGTDTPPALNLVVSTRGARVQGEIDDGGAIDRRLPVLLAPVGKTREVMSFYAGGLSEKGKFELTGLTPGKYRIYAFEPTSAGMDMRNPDLLDKLSTHAESLDIGEGAVVTAHPKLITAQQIEEALQ